MRRTELQILEELRHGPVGRAALAEAIGKSRSWTSELVHSLADQHLVEGNGRVALADTYEASLLGELLIAYDLEKVLSGKREHVLNSLFSGPKTVSELERRGIAASTVYAVLDDLGGVGAVEETDDGYRIADDTLRTFLEARQSRPFETAYTADGSRVVVTTRDDVDGTPTGFSAFRRYGVDYYPNNAYLYQGARAVGLEAVLIHAVLCAENRKQMAMCGVFYLTHRATLDASDLWRLANRWECVEKWADLFAYIDQREVHHEELFLPWKEFLDLANDYGIYPRGQHPED
ncbi:MAG: transcriptional regulator, partial [archaeon]